MSTVWRPSRRQVLIAGGLTSGLFALGGGFNLAAAHGLQTRQRAGLAFGTTISFKAVHKDADRLEAGLDPAWAEIVRVEEAASLFRPESALSRLNREGVLENPPAALLEMLELSQRAARLTSGAFDVTVQPLWSLYANAFASGQAPSDDELAAVRDLVGYENIVIEASRIVLKKRGMALTLNGIAQGYATEQCLRVLREHGITDAFLNTGEIGVAGKRDDKQLWTAAIADPRDGNGYVALTHPLSGILSTSGDYATAFTSDFAAHHIFDPSTLRSPPELASVSVLAQSGGLSDALATAMMVMGAEKSLQLAQSLEGVEVFLVTKQGARKSTQGFPSV